MEFGSLITANSGFSIIATDFLVRIRSSFFPVVSLYILTFTCLGYHSTIFAVRIEPISNACVISGFAVAVVGTTATHPSSSIDITTSCMNALPV